MWERLFCILGKSAIFHFLGVLESMWLWCFTKVWQCSLLSTTALHSPSDSKMIEFFPPNLEHFCPYVQFAQMGHICPDGVTFAQNTTTNPCSLPSCHTPLYGILCPYTKHLKPHAGPTASHFSKYTSIWKNDTLPNPDLYWDIPG